MKKTIALILAALMILSLAACAAKPNEPAPEVSKEAAAEPKQEETPAEEAPVEEVPAEKTKMTLWMPPYASEETLDSEFWARATAPWTEENNVELEITIVPWGNYEERYMTGFASGEGPDVGYMYNEMLFEYVDKGMIEPMDQYLTAEDLDNYKFLSLGQIGGKQMTMPICPGGMRVIYYNVDILEAAGITEIPNTWQEFVDACQKIKESNPDVVPYAQSWGDESIGSLNANYYPFLWSADGDLFHDDGTVALMDNDGAVKSANFLNELLNTYQIMPADTMAYKEADLVTMFTEGKLAFLSVGIGKAKTITDSGVNWEFIPSLTEKEEDTWYTFSSADALVMNAATKHKELAWSLIHYITSAECMTLFNTEMNPGPGLTKDAPYLANEKFVDLYAATEHLHPLPVAKNSVSLLQSLKANLQLMLLGDMTPEEAIQESVDYFNSIS